MKWRRGILICALIVVGVVVLAFVTNYRSEPHYKGKSLSAWLRVHQTGDETAEHDAEVAVRRIGTNAIPYLMADLTNAGPAWANRAAQVLQHLPAPISAWPQSVLDRNYRRGCAMEGFAILGPDAAPAVPELLRLLGGSQWAVAVKPLSAIGKPALMPLVGVLTNQTNVAAVRGNAALSLGMMGTNAGEVAHTLLSTVAADDFGSEVPAWSLARVALDAEAVIPTLTSVAKSGHLSSRLGAISALGYLGPRAQSAVPALNQCLVDGNRDVRDQATNALSNILRWCLPS